MDSYYTIVSNQAVINYSGDKSSCGGSQSYTNIVSTLVYRPLLIIYTPMADLCQQCCCYFYCNRICIYNYSLNFLEDVYIRFKLSPQLEYTVNSLSADVEHDRNENFMQIYIKTIKPMEIVWIKFECMKYGEPLMMHEVISKGNITYFIESNMNKIYFNKKFIIKYGDLSNDISRFLHF